MARDNSLFLGVQWDGSAAVSAFRTFFVRPLNVHLFIYIRQGKCFDALLLCSEFVFWKCRCCPMIITSENPTQEHASGPWGLTRFLPKGFGACIYLASRLTKLDFYRANLRLLCVILYLLLILDVWLVRHIVWSKCKVCVTQEVYMRY